MANPPIITLLTDFGLTDHYVAAMKGVILGICPEARIVDISHEIRAFGIEEAAFVLSQAYPCFPKGTIHVVVVDPGVGSARRPLLLEADGQCFVGPDNGVFSFPLDRDAGARAREITGSRFFRHPVSKTFHGRDIFAPVAAHLAAGIAANGLGTQISDPVKVPFPSPVKREDGVWIGSVLYVDRFGSLVTNFRLSDVPEIAHAAFEMAVGGVTGSWYQGAYCHTRKGEIFVIEASSGYLEVSINQGDAALFSDARSGSPVTLRF